jgi:exodeoxyribonuclease III
MKIATWNVNSIRQREKHVARWLEQCQPDVLLLQEIKCEAPAFPALTYHALGYKADAVGQKAYNGVAVLSRLPFTVTHRALPGLPSDDAQSRYIEVETDGITVIGIYLPNGNSGGEAGFTYKLAWLDRLAERLPDRRGPRARRAVSHRRIGAAGKPRPLSPPALGWPDRRGPRRPSAWRRLYILGLSGWCLAA